MQDKPRSMGYALIYLIAIISLLATITLINLNKEKATGATITGFATAENASNETISENITTVTETTAQETTANETIINETEKEKPAKPEPNVPPVWKLEDINEFVVAGETTIDLNEFFSDKNNDTIAYTASQPENIAVEITLNLITLKADGHNFNASIELTASDGDKQTKKEVKLIVPERKITISLEYGSGANYDAENDGTESISGIIDLTVENTGFNWDANQENLCTRWETYSVENAESTFVCYGSQKCCQFVDLLATRPQWNEPFYSAYGTYGASFNNVVSAQALYVDYDLAAAEPFAEIYYSDAAKLNANYYLQYIDFKNVCIDTCLLENFNQTSYNLIFEIDNAVLELDKLIYTIAETISEVLVSLEIGDSEGMVSGAYNIYKNGVLVNVTGNSVEPDYYDIEIIPEQNVIEKLIIYNANLTAPLTGTIGIDNVSREMSIENVEIKKQYAIDASALDFDNAVLTATAEGNSLFKCKQWDYDTEVCFGSWEKVKDLVAGEEYELTITPDDPGFVEGDLNITILPENITLVNITNITGLALIKNIPNITIIKNNNLTIDLSLYFANIDNETIFTYFAQDNITILFENNIATIIPSQEFIGAKYTFITANQSGNLVVSNVFSITVINVTLNITPEIILKKKDFRLDEDIEIDFEYLKKEELVKKGKWKDEFEVYEEETEKTEQELELLKQKIEDEEKLLSIEEKAAKKQKKRFDKQKETLETFVLDNKGEPALIQPEIEELREGKFKVKLPKQRAFKAGKYTLKLKLTRSFSPNVTYEIEQDFTWGVLAINVNKSIYLPNEDSFIGIGVLDDQGKIVCNADVTLTIINPLNQTTILTTQNNEIKISPECSFLGVTSLPDYYTDYSVSGVGKYIMNLTAITANGVRNIQDNFSVQSSVDFDVARYGPTRVYPKAAYTMKIPIIANQNYNGIINEYVPAGFDISEVEIYEVQEETTLSSAEDTETSNKVSEPLSGITLLAINENNQYSSKSSSSATNSLPLNSLTSDKSDDKALTSFSTVGGWTAKTIMPKNSFGGNADLLRKSESLESKTNDFSFASEASLPLLTPLAAYSAGNPFDLRNSLTSILMFSSSRNFGILTFSSDKPGGIVQSIPNHLFSQAGVAFNYAFNTFPGSNQFNNVANQNPGAPEGGLSMADFAVRNDVLADFNSHTANNDNSVFKGFEKEKDALNKILKNSQSEFLGHQKSERFFSETILKNNKNRLINEIADFFTLIPSATAQINTQPTITTVNDTKIISIPADLKKGKKYILSYKFDAPDISPEFYVLGPLDIGSFKETRQWQIANDQITEYKIFSEGFESGWETVTAQTCDSTPDCAQIGSFTNCDHATSDYLFCASSDTSPDMSVTGSMGFQTEDWDGGSETATNGIWFNFNHSTACGGSSCDYITLSAWVWEAGLDASEFCWFTEQVGAGTPAAIMTISTNNPASYTLNSSNLTNTASTSTNIRLMCDMGAATDDVRFDNINITGYALPAETVKPRINASLNNNKPVFGEIVNITANVSDNQALSTCNFFTNGTSDGSTIILNKTVSGTNDQCSQNWTIDLTRGNVINFTVRVNDAKGNFNLSMNSTRDEQIGQVIRVRQKAEASGGSWDNLTAQACNQENDQAVKGTFDQVCDTTYLGTCAAGVNGVSCNDGTELEIFQSSSSGADWGGINISVYNDLITDCEDIAIVNLCYEWWASAATIQSCDISVDADGGTSFTAVTTTCPGTTVDPGVTCTDVTSSEAWTCDSFFGETGTRAMAKSNGQKASGGGSRIFTVDALWFNVTYRVETVVDITPPVVNVSLNKSLTTIRVNDIINVSANATDVGGALRKGVIGHNMSGTLINYSKVLSGTRKQFSQNITVNLTKGGIINFSVVVKDRRTPNNQRLNDTIITVANSPPETPTILFPANDMKFNAINIPMNATFPKDADNDAVTIKFYINGKINESTNVNGTFNASDGVYLLNVSLFDGEDSSANATTINFTLDRKVPVVNATLNESFTNIKINDVINLTANATDNRELSFGQIIVNDTGFKRYFNFSLDSEGRKQFSQNITVACNGGCVINFTARSNDTANNFRTNDTIITVKDNINPVVNATLNKSLSSIFEGDVINITANATDNLELSFGQIIVNDTGFKRYFNFSLEGYNKGNFSQNITVACAAGCVINFTARANDTTNNFRTNDTIITVI